MRTNNNVNWGLNEEMEALLNGIDLSSDRHVIMTAGDKQFICDDGQIYRTSTTTFTKGKQLTKEEFREQAQEIKINTYMFRKNNDIIIE